MSRYVVQAGWSDVPHLTEQDKKELIDSLHPHQRDARTKGIPSLGAGAIYPIQEEDVTCEPFKIPEHYAKIYGLDVGWKKTAAIWGAWDRDSDIIYCYSEHYRGQAEPSIHASAVKARGAWIPGNIDYAGSNQANGERTMSLYENEGLNLFLANKAVGAGLLEVYQRLSSGRIKFFTTLQHTLIEYRIYRRNEKGKIVKENDHLMDALRYLVMGLENASIKPIQVPEINIVIGDSVAGY